MIVTDVQRLEQDSIVELYEIDATSYGGSLLRFATSPVDGQPAVFGGNTFLPFPIKAEGFEWSGKGTMPRPTLTVSSIDLAFLALVISADDLVGAPVRRIRTYRKHLDDGSDPDSAAIFPVDYYVVERKSNQTRQNVQFELSVLMDQDARKDTDFLTVRLLTIPV